MAAPDLSLERGRDGVVSTPFRLVSTTDSATNEFTTMDIVWRNRPVKSDARAAFLKEPEWMRGMDMEEPWRPLFCTHGGPDRVAHTPLIMHSTRTDGGPRQELVERLPTIRSCCLSDRFARAAWWYEVDRTFVIFRAGGLAWPRSDVRRFEGKLRKALLAVVAAATRAGIRDFEAYRLLKEQEHQERERAAAATWAAAEATRRAEEAARREEERIRAEYERASGGGRPGEFVSPECFDVLGLPRDASMEEVKRRHRELVKEHHPDRDGDPLLFRRYQAAFEAARKLRGGR